MSRKTASNDSLFAKPKHIPVGDRALLVQFSSAIRPEINNQVRTLFLAIQQKDMAGGIESVPTYRSLMINYDPLIIKLKDLNKKIREIEGELSQFDLPKPKVYKIPVLYGGVMGPDLEFVAQYNHLTEEEVIKIHSSQKYLIYMLGFTPGFPYLGGMSKRIATPRLDKPRVKISAGSVGIAGDQTGVYPTQSPGGWRVIGRTPVKLYTPDHDPPVLLKMGNYIQFISVSEGEYKKIKSQKDRGTYQVETYPINKNEH